MANSIPEASSLDDVLSLSAHLREFTSRRQFADFFSGIIMHEKMPQDLDAYYSLAFSFAHASQRFLSTPQMSAMRSVAQKINKAENITNPFALSRLTLPKHPKDSPPAKKEIFSDLHLPDALTKKTFSFLRFDELSQAMLACRHLARLV